VGANARAARSSAMEIISVPCETRGGTFGFSKSVLAPAPKTWPKTVSETKLLIYFMFLKAKEMWSNRRQPRLQMEGLHRQRAACRGAGARRPRPMPSARRHRMAAPRARAARAGRPAAADRDRFRWPAIRPRYKLAPMKTALPLLALLAVSHHHGDRAANAAPQGRLLPERIPRERRILRADHPRCASGHPKS
jgi:hypothetical protein